YWTFENSDFKRNDKQYPQPNERVEQELDKQARISEKQNQYLKQILDEISSDDDKEDSNIEDLPGYHSEESQESDFTHQVEQYDIEQRTENDQDNEKENEVKEVDFNQQDKRHDIEKRTGDD